MKNLFANRRVVAITIFLITILSVICVSLYVWADPQLNAIATATRVILTQDSRSATKSVAESQTALPMTNNALTFDASLTQTAVPTITFTPTLTITPSYTPSLTFTPTPTSTPELISCATDVSSKLGIYKQPSLAVSQLTTVDSGEKINIIANAAGTGWYLVETSQGQRGWLPNESMPSVTCPISSASLAYLAGWDGGRNYVFNDIFAGPTVWKDQAGKTITPLKNQNTYILRLSNEVTQASPFNVAPPIPYLSDFSFYTSLLFVSNKDYIGVRFWDDGENYYELRVNNNCQITLVDSANINDLVPRDPIGTQSFCYGGQNTFLEMHVVDSQLSVYLNGAQMVPFTLTSNYQGSGFSIKNAGADINFEYFVITSP